MTNHELLEKLREKSRTGRCKPAALALQCMKCKRSQAKVMTCSHVECDLYPYRNCVYRYGVVVASASAPDTVLEVSLEQDIG